MHAYSDARIFFHIYAMCEFVGLGDQFYWHPKNRTFVVYHDSQERSAPGILMHYFGHFLNFDIFYLACFSQNLLPAAGKKFQLISRNKLNSIVN